MMLQARANTVQPPPNPAPPIDPDHPHFHDALHALPVKSHHSDSHLYEIWLASRVLDSHPANYLAPGAHRPLCRPGLKLAYRILRSCSLDLFAMLWALHPWRTLLMISLEFVRGVLPAFKGFSHAVLLNELQSFMSTGHFDLPRLTTLALAEGARLAGEVLIDSLASTNENIVHGSARLLLEYQQLAQRVRLDVPTLADPAIRDLLQESDLFVRSFNGVSSFGLLSTFDLMRILMLCSELASHIWVLSTLTADGARSQMSPLLLSVLVSLLPLARGWFGPARPYLDDDSTPQEARTAAKQEHMRGLAHSDPHRQEVLLFGLGPWILESWACARKAMLGLEQTRSRSGTDVWADIVAHIDLSGMLVAVQNIPLVLLMQSPSASLGSFTLYRSSVQALFFTAGSLLHSIRMAYQGIFLMGAFCAAMTVQPRLEPAPHDALAYTDSSTGRGMRIELRNISYTYPGSKHPALRDVSLTVEAGETLAIVGFNGSGKSTLAKIILRILDFHGGELLVNGTDVRRFRPGDLHAHVTAVFQDFSRFNASAQENVGIGFVQEVTNAAAVNAAMRGAGAREIVRALPQGMKTRLDAAGMPDTVVSGAAGGHQQIRASCAYSHHGLSGGEWQRIAISRAFMRAHRPEIDLILLDEPTSSLDPHAQNRIFESIDKFARSPAPAATTTTGAAGADAHPGSEMDVEKETAETTSTSTTSQKTKTVIYITHRLATARRADKIAMMENGTISEFGSHDELLARNGQYAALYRASI